MALTYDSYHAVKLTNLLSDRSLKPGDLVMEVYTVTPDAGASFAITCKNINNVVGCMFSMKTAQANDIWATAGGVYWSASGATLTITPKNNIEAEAINVLVIGTYESTTAPAL